MKSECKHCEYWKTETSNQGNGECHRKTPFKTSDQTQASWPETSSVDWCGDFRYDLHQEQDVPRKCTFCEYWKKEEYGQDNGECHHDAPTKNHTADQPAWASTKNEDWCGEFMVRSGKLVGTTTCPT